MITYKKITLLGGDARQATAADKLLERGHCISFFAGASEQTARSARLCSLEEALADPDVVVLPLPATTDGIHLNAPFYKDGSIELASIIAKMPTKALVVGGKIPDSFISEAEKRGICVVDYFKSEAFQIKNAYTTAEAAIFVAMNNMKKNLRASRFAITGYGRIARNLADMLLNFGAEVTVLARKESDLAWASLRGARARKLTYDSIFGLKDGYDIIFNTVPTYLFMEDFLCQMDKDTLIVDLASAPGGIDVSAAKRCGARVLWAASLPGKYAPVSAGELIAECVGDIIESEVAKC